MQGSQNVSEEKANHQEEAAGPERRRREQAREVRGHDPPENFENQFSKSPFSCNLSDQTLILSLKYGLYSYNFLKKMFGKSMVFNAFGKLITVIKPCS